MVPNPNYIPMSTAMMPPPSAHQHNVLATLPPATDIGAPKFSHKSDLAHAPPPSPIGYRFVPNNNTCTHEMTKIIKLMYDHPWLSYKKIPSEARERWFQKWRQLQQILEDVRERRDQLSSWLRPKMKKVLYVQWETDEGFKHQRLTNRATRHWPCRPSIPSKSLDRKATLAETFKYTHTLKENKAKFAD
ncbi:hypothetical protein Ahy_A02g008792 [Arachis hypogaea]|uniref:Uncharacterized protein n=1 Tax=Arachis hypogaea TaxID=3818 RepID=A0A445EF69_ARAHY|nr:hypothetical protein Ahy_A02g008792 [Arachis hypogaea]